MQVLLQCICIISITSACYALKCFSCNGPLVGGGFPNLCASQNNNLPSDYRRDWITTVTCKSACFTRLDARYYPRLYRGCADDFDWMRTDNNCLGLAGSNRPSDWPFRTTDVCTCTTDNCNDDSAVFNYGCFTGDDWVSLEDGSNKKMSDVVPGDRVLAMNEDGELTYTPVTYFAHRDEKLFGLFVAITTENGYTIDLTHEHYIYILNKDSQKSELIYADQVNVGDILLTAQIDNNWTPSKVTKTQTVYRQGNFFPKTDMETIVVNGIVSGINAALSDEQMKTSDIMFRIESALAPLYPDVYDSSSRHPITTATRALAGLLQLRDYDQYYKANKTEAIKSLIFQQRDACFDSQSWTFI